jgi:cytochrome c1
MRGFAKVATLGLAAAIGWGCSDEEVTYKLVKVTGTVTRNGKPLADAGVSFIPDAGNKSSTPGIDRSGEEGNYMLTFKGRTGIAPGKYKVMVTPPRMDMPSGVSMPPGLENQPFMLEKAQRAKNAGTKRGREATKEAAKSTFDAQVEDQGGGVVLDFDVKSPETSRAKATR